MNAKLKKSLTSEVISEARLESALAFMAQTDGKLADAKVFMMRLEYAADLARKRCFLVAHGNVEERKAMAENDDTVQKRMGEYFDAVATYEKLRARRTTEELIIEVWRSLNSARTHGIFS